MTRLFADTTDKELEENQLGAGMCLTIAFVLLILIAGFFGSYGSHTEVK
jgi:hypothetical protein